MPRTMTTQLGMFSGSDAKRGSIVVFVGQHLPHLVPRGPSRAQVRVSHQYPNELKVSRL